MAGTGTRCIALINSDPGELMASSSGGAFSILARDVLARGGAVYGHAFDGDLHVVCTRVDSVGGLARLRGSKYVQSDMGRAMSSVLADLGAGMPVLFSGTPCQVAGLRAFLSAKGADASELLLVDIVCHGVPSQGFFRDCMACEHPGGSVEEVRFRDKREGWGCGGGTTTTTTTPVFHRLVTRDEPFSPQTSYYYRRFLAGDVYRESCYRCPYAGGPRPGDVTVGDFWGVDHAAAGLSPRRGVSLAIANTRAGERALEVLEASSLWAERPLAEALAGNDQLRHPTSRPAGRDVLLERWREEGAAPLVGEYRRETAGERRTWLAKRALKRIARKVLGR